MVATGFTDAVGFRIDDADKQLGRFAAGSSTGSLELEAPIGSFNFESSGTLVTSFEASIEDSGSSDQRSFSLELRSETDYSAGIGTSIRIELDANETSRLGLRPVD